MLASFARTLPGELHHAGLIDGANAWQAFLHIVLPLLRPAVAISALPLVLAYVLLTRQFIAGLSAGAIKG